jgi:phage nucleotide-binding protein
MDIKNTKDYPDVASMVMMVYGMGGVGKTTFASTFPTPLLLDFENGAKYFGERGIEIDVAVFKKWLTQEDKTELKEKLDDYETIVIDPIGEAMDKLINDQDTVSGSKYRQSNGDLTMSGWGEVKKQMRNFIKWLRDTNKNVLLVAHVDEGKDDELLVKRPLIPTKLSDEIVTMVDVVGYMKIIQHEGESKRVIMVDSTDEKVISKDRTGKLGKYIKPDYKYLLKEIQGDKETTQGSKGKKE